jgi:hypothetical protein
MSMTDSEPMSPRFSPPGLIAWMSLFLLAFALGGTVNERWQKLSLQAGAVGLISAVGLGSLEKARRIRASKRRDRIARERLDRRFALEEWDAANGWQFESSPNRAVNSAADQLHPEPAPEREELNLVGKQS